ncbi:MAG TPA: hypothetical protein VG096_25150 [Bryobacteraceae bacterium]|jgi:hypothetical protein|nr:hypothetical protein [Bryobacteraceae bacterium]
MRIVALMTLTLLAMPAQPQSAKTYTPPKTADGQPDIAGVWSNASIVPLERPKELEGKQFFTSEEEAAYEKKVFARSSRDKTPAEGAVGTYNDFWWDADSKRAVNFRTSLIVDPPDGRIPPLTAAAQKKLQADRAYAAAHPADGPEDRALMERCLLFPTTGPPMLPSFYNNSVFGALTTNYQIVQTREYVTILVELNHDVRIVPLDGRPHIPSNVRQWLGNSRGHWEGNTLVVDTTNFTDKTKFRGADENLHLTERFTRIAADTLLYEFTMNDPTAFTKPWKGEIPMIASSGPLYEHACNEGNYGLAGILGGARADEKKGLK